VYFYSLSSFNHHVGVIPQTAVEIQALSNLAMEIQGLPLQQTGETLRSFSLFHNSFHNIDTRVRNAGLYDRGRKLRRPARRECYHNKGIAVDDLYNIE